MAEFDFDPPSRASEIATIISRVSDGTDTNRFVTNNGVVLQLKPVKYTVIIEALKQVQKPKPPIMYIEELGRMDENLADPDYKEAMLDYNLARAEVITNVYLLMGTSVQDIPHDVPPIESNGWIEDLELVGIKIPGTDNPKLRYVAWLKYVVLEDHNELASLQKRVMRLSGIVLEEDAQEAENSFPHK